MTFVRRYTAFPTLDVITQIEGIVVVDVIPVGVFVGRATGKVCLVGEWPGGPFNTPTQVEGDATIRDTFKGMSLSLTDPLSFASNPFSNGCAFTWLKGKKFRSLVLVRADLTLAEGVQIKLTSSPSVTATGTITFAGPGLMTDGRLITVSDGLDTPTIFEMDSGGGVASGHVAIPFTALLTGAQIAAAAQTAINAVGAGLQLTSGAPVGSTITLTNDHPGAHGNVDITTTETAAGFSVSGMSGGLGLYLLAADLKVPAGTRVRDASAPTREYALAQDVVFAAGTDLSAAAFTAFDEADLAATYSTRTVSAIPVYSTQGVSEGAVSNVDAADSTDLFRANIGVGTGNPLVAVAASTGALDGSPANVAALTALSSAQIDARYGDAIDSTLPGDEVVDAVEFIESARQSNAIRLKLSENATASSFNSTGRTTAERPPIGTLPAAARSSSAPGVGANRSDRVDYAYPHFKQFIPELAALDPTEAISPSTILVGADAALASVMSNLPPENNPGQSTQAVVSGGLLPYILGLEDGLTGVGMPTKFGMEDYILFKAAGMAVLKRDTKLGEWVFQSGVTSVDPELYPSLVNIKRRRMTDFLEDSMATIAAHYSKLPNTTDRYDALLGDLDAFLTTLLSPNNGAAQRIEQYAIDSKSGNTAILSGLGVKVIIVRVRELSTLDDIVLQVEAGEQVTVSVLEG